MPCGSTSAQRPAGNGRRCSSGAVLRCSCRLLGAAADIDSRPPSRGARAGRRTPVAGPHCPHPRGVAALVLFDENARRAQREEHHVVHAPPRTGQLAPLPPGVAACPGPDAGGLRRIHGAAGAGRRFQRVPADPALAQVCSASCKLCHANPASTRADRRCRCLGATPGAGHRHPAGPQHQRLQGHATHGHVHAVLGRTVPGFDRFMSAAQDR